MGDSIDEEDISPSIMDNVEKVSNETVEEGALKDLHLSVCEQSKLEESILNQVEKRLQEEAEQKWEIYKNKLEEDIQKREKDLEETEGLLGNAKTFRQVSSLSGKLNTLREKIEELKEKLLEWNETKEQRISQSLNLNEKGESTQEARVKAGEMTPFGTVLTPSVSGHFDGPSTSSGGRSYFEEYLKAQQDLEKKHQAHSKKSPLKKSILKNKKGRRKTVMGSGTSEVGELSGVSPGKVAGEKQSIYLNSDDDSEYIPSSDSEVSNPDWEHPSFGEIQRSVPKQRSKKRSPTKSEGLRSDDPNPKSSKREMRIIDDGNPVDYRKRVKAWNHERLKEKHQKILNDEEIEEEMYESFDGEYRIPHSIWNKLYKYQQVGVHWLWELHEQGCGGILGDEMGLGKTIQIISFLAGLSYSNLPSISFGCKWKGLGPVLIITPATVMQQWVKEFHDWWPPFRVAILHESGAFVGRKKDLIVDISQSQGILITSYTGVVQNQKDLLAVSWHYVILDEGHKIRNPESQATGVVKCFPTSHRLILSGSPLQNNLKELWSLFDFIYPGKLGTLQTFITEFSVPITLGGYATASKMEVAIAYRCACVLRDTIKPYLLRRMKSDVKQHLTLPNKNEQVLFCRLTEYQRELYREYLDSKELKNILDGRLQVFVGLIHLRKICNHPDLYNGNAKLDQNQSEFPEEDQYGYWKKSGKMIVVETLLKLWKKQNHKVLLFTQSRKMLCILEAFAQAAGYTYLKMDGGTYIGGRQSLIHKFNTDPNIFLFLLTTRVGGLGVNLTGANRVIIYDPDWNPSVDTQARERAWRIGQGRDVTIYRLLTSGTIEEKIYHRQIFKQYLTDRVLKDPRQRRFFKANELHELFRLTDVDPEEGETESSALFTGLGSVVKPKELKKSGTVGKPHAKRNRVEEKEGMERQEEEEEERIQRMRDLARKLSQQISQTYGCVAGGKAVEESKPCPRVEHKSSRIAGKKIPHLVKRRYKKDELDEGSVDAEQRKLQHQHQDEYVLVKLFKKSGVHSALRHDKIVDSSQADHDLMQIEADRVAYKAVAALKNSRRQYVGFTQHSSSSSSSIQKSSQERLRFGQKRKAIPKPAVSVAPVDISSTSKEEEGLEDPSSSSVLMKLRKLSEASFIPPPTSTIDTIFHNSDEPSDEEVVWTGDLSAEYRDLVEEIRGFLAVHDGQATSEELVGKFRDKLPSEACAVFKSMLNRLCSFYRMDGGVGVWRLRSDFR